LKNLESTLEAMKITQNISLNDCNYAI